MPTTQFAAFEKTAIFNIKARPANVLSIDGLYGGSGNEFFQVYDIKDTTTTNEVPIISYKLTAAGPLPSFFETIAPLTLRKGFTVGISTDENSYVASASQYTVFGSVDMLEPPQNDPNRIITTVAATVGSPAIWTNTAANNVKRLLALSVAISEGVTPLYVLLGTKPLVSGAGARAIWTSPAQADATTKNYYFGSEGLLLMQHDTAYGDGSSTNLNASGANNINSLPNDASGRSFGCYAYVSTTPGTLTSAGGTDATTFSGKVLTFSY